jgi:diadenosine tetraphosphate (Ap4A) HIT family hydrolase
MPSHETQPACPYCESELQKEQAPHGGWIYRSARYVVRHGNPDSASPGAIQIISRRHFTDFTEMVEEEATSFGTLVAILDRALRVATDAERVHLVSTRDRVAHFHAWLYPRPESHPLRGTAFLAARQRCTPDEAARAAAAIRAAPALPG